MVGVPDLRGVGRRARVTVDLRTIMGASTTWDWPAGTIHMYNAEADWSAAPWLTFTVLDWNQSPQAGQFTAG